MSRPAFAYLPVSGRGQVDGDGFPRQLEAIEKYAAEHGYHIAQVFREEGVNGTSEWENRPAYTHMMVELLSDGVRTVIIEKLDRLARDLMVQEHIIADLRAKQIRLVSVHEPDLLADDPSRKLMRQIMGAIAEYDRAMLVAKLKAARERKRALTGRCEGRMPYGEKPGEQEVVERIVALRREGKTRDGIADWLNRKGIKPRSGARWHVTSVSRVLARAETTA